MFPADGIFGFPPAFIAFCRYRNNGSATAVVCSVGGSRARLALAEKYSEPFGTLCAGLQGEFCTDIPGYIPPVSYVVQGFHFLSFFSVG